MKKIKEVIVVEGQNDINKILSCLDCDCVKTNGTHLSKQFLNQLVDLNQRRGVIVFCDDDYPGRWIRTQIQEKLKTCKHAYIDKKVSRTKTKVGVEHASCQDIIESLERVCDYDSNRLSLSYEEYIELGFIGQPQSSQLRKTCLTKLNLPPMNAKRFYKTLNMMNITSQEIRNMVNDGNN